jgi:methanogenic corrinoid protein MtbC1
MTLEETRTPFLEALLSGRRAECARIVQELLGAKVPLSDLYLDLYQRAMIEVGSRWEKNLITVADEHLATAILESLFFLSGPEIFRTPRNGCRVVMACVPGEYHQIGARVVSDFFEWKGWDSQFLGADTPSGDLVRLVRDRRPDLLGLSISMFFNLPALKSTLDLLRGELPDLPILIGGKGLAHHGAEMERRYPGVHYLPSGRALLVDPFLKGGFS